MKKRFARRIAALPLLVHSAGWAPLALLIWDWAHNNLTVNPIQAATQRTGIPALIFLILSLACRPLYTLTRYAPLLKQNRSLGLYGWMYAAIHVALFIAVDYGLDLPLILEAVAEKRFVIVGLLAFLVATLLAITSFRWWMVRLGKRWKQLHRLVYLLNALVVLHFAWSIKGDVARLQGDVLRPLIAGAIVALLLILRIPAVRRKLTGVLPVGPRRPQIKRPARSLPTRTENP